MNAHLGREEYDGKDGGLLFCHDHISGCSEFYERLKEIDETKCPFGWRSMPTEYMLENIRLRVDFQTKLKPEVERAAGGHHNHLHRLLLEIDRRHIYLQNNPLVPMKEWEEMAKFSWD